MRAKLPFRDSTFDGVLMDRVLEHVTNPGEVLSEVVCVTRPGGRVVVIDLDHEMTCLSSQRDDLSRRLRLNSLAKVRNPTVGRHLASLMTGAGMTDVAVEGRVLTWRELDLACIPRDLQAAATEGLLTSEEATAFVSGLRVDLTQGGFMFAGVIIIVCGRTFPQ